MDLKFGKELIDAIEQTRKEINKEKYHINNANSRISEDEQSSTDEMWKKIKTEYEIKLQQSTKKLEILYEKFYLLKNSYSKLYWDMLLEILGCVIAKTENICHVEDSLHDEFELKKAIDQTELAIENCYEILKQDKENEDLVVIINSELKYYESDMKKHHWGEERLKRIKNVYEEKNESFFRI